MILWEPQGYDRILICSLLGLITSLSGMGSHCGASIFSFFSRRVRDPSPTPGVLFSSSSSYGYSRAHACGLSSSTQNLDNGPTTPGPTTRSKPGQGPAGPSQGQAGPPTQGPGTHDPTKLGRAPHRRQTGASGRGGATHAPRKEREEATHAATKTTSHPG